MEHHRRREERIEKGGDFYIQRQHTVLNTAGMQWAKERIEKGRRFFPTRKGAIRKGNFTQNDKQGGKRETDHLSACVVCNGRCALYELDHTSSIDSMFSPDSSSCQYLSAKWSLHCNLCLILVKANIFSIHPLSSSSQHTLVHLSARISQNNFSKLSAQIMPCFLYLAI